MVIKTELNLLRHQMHSIWISSANSSTSHRTCVLRRTQNMTRNFEMWTTQILLVWVPNVGTSNKRNGYANKTRELWLPQTNYDHTLGLIKSRGSIIFPTVSKPSTIYLWITWGREVQLDMTCNRRRLWLWGKIMWSLAKCHSQSNFQSRQNLMCSVILKSF